MKLELIATSTFGLEAVVAREVKDLDFDNVVAENGKVTFSGGPDAICRANLWLRTADRVRLKVGEFEAVTFEELFEKTKALPWAELLPPNACFPVEGKSVKSTLFSVSDCQAIVKKAVVESMKKKYRKKWFEESGPLFKIEVSLLKDTATLTIDTSGAGLHKRGYRERAGPAPLRETLAAALVILSRWHPDTILVDPLCGTGTIPIEAALMGRNIAPGLYRNFVAEKWPLVPGKLWQKAREEARDLAVFDCPLDITATDSEERAVRLARTCAREAGVEDAFHLQRRSLSELSSKKKYGKIICNPPYGERLGEQEQSRQLYREMGRVFSPLDTWSLYILTADREFEKYFGRRASKKRKLYNGRIRVDFYQYYGPRPPPKKAREGEAEGDGK